MVVSSLRADFEPGGNVDSVTVSVTAIPRFPARPEQPLAREHAVGLPSGCVPASPVHPVGAGDAPVGGRLVNQEVACVRLLGPP